MTVEEQYNDLVDRKWILRKRKGSPHDHSNDPEYIQRCIEAAYLSFHLPKGKSIFCRHPDGHSYFKRTDRHACPLCMESQTHEG